MKAILLSRKDLIFPGLLGLISLMFIAKLGDAGDFAISILSLMALTSLLLDQSEYVNPPISWLRSKTIAALITVSLLLFASNHFLPPASFARSLPLILLLSYWLITDGSKIFEERWKHLLILGLLAIPDRMLLAPLTYPVLHLFGWDAMTFPTAHLAGFLTSASGLPASVNHLDITMENAIVTVWQGCDGSRNMDFLLRLSLFLIITMPVKPSRWFTTVTVAVLLAFIINTIRISLLAHLANSGDMAAFDYWHEGDGSKIFNLVAIILFSVFGYFQISTRPNDDSKPANDDRAATAG